MKKSVILLIFIFTVLFSCSIVAQRTGRGNENINLPKKVQNPAGDPLPAGTYTIGSGGNFPTISSAFSKLRGDGITGSVTMELIDTLYTAALNGFFLSGPIPGAGPNSRVTIEPAENKNVTVEGLGTGFQFANVSYLTLDGVSLTGTTTLTVHALSNTQEDNGAVYFNHNSDHNVVQNITAITDNLLRSAGIGFAEFNTAAIDKPDSNLIQNNFIKKAWNAIYVASWSTSGILADGNIIRGNIIGSETDSLISWSIEVEQTQNTIIEGNIIQNIRTPKGDNGFPQPIIFGIDLDWCYNGIIRNNIVHNVKSNSVQCIGILLRKDPVAQSGRNNLVYNNMIYDIESRSSSSGITVSEQENPQIYYNSVYLSGTGSNSIASSSSALELDAKSTNVLVKNNIFVNTRDESPGLASSIKGYKESNLSSDNNDLYCAQNQNSFLVNMNSNKYSTLSDWQAKGHDLLSVSEMPNFEAPDLHIDESIPTNLESHGTPVAGIDVDFDGDARGNDSSDIGADEFDGKILTGINDEVNLPITFSLEQNYPNPFNPSTTIKYSIPQTSFVTLKIYDVLGREVSTLVNEEKTAGNYQLNFDASNIASGIYFYKIQSGNFVNIKKMVLIK